MKLRILGAVLNAAALIHRNPEHAQNLRDLGRELAELDRRRVPGR
jgi:hypothetical protein